MISNALRTSSRLDFTAILYYFKDESIKPYRVHLVKRTFLVFQILIIKLKIKNVLFLQLVNVQLNKLF